MSFDAYSMPRRPILHSTYAATAADEAHAAEEPHERQNDTA